MNRTTKCQNHKNCECELHVLIGTEQNIKCNVIFEQINNLFLIIQQKTIKTD